MKVDYMRKKPKRWVWRGGCTTHPITRGLPFYQSKPGCYVHRVRYANLHTWPGEKWPAHTSFEFWCSGTGFIDTKGHRDSRLLAELPPGEVLCATCEGRAIGAGQVGSPVICGRPVKFSPRV